MRTAVLTGQFVPVSKKRDFRFPSTDELVTHSVFGYRISYRRVLDVQARLFARYLCGEIDTFPEFRVR